MAEKVCTGCNQLKNLEDYHKSSKEKSGYNSKCKQCKRDYYLLNKNKYAKKYQDNAESFKAYSNSWRSQNKQHLSDYFKNYRKARKDRVAFWNKTYQCRKTKATPSWLTKKHLEEIAYYYTLSSEAFILTGEKYHVDHIVPLKGKNICGLHVPWNLQVIPKSDNLRKGNKF